MLENKNDRKTVTKTVTVSEFIGVPISEVDIVEQRPPPKNFDLKMKIKPDTDEAGANAISLSFTSEYPVYSPGSEHLICANLHLDAPEMKEDDAARPPVDMVLVVDRSGSMAGSRIQLVKRVLEFIVEELDNENDRIGLVDYGSDVSTTLPLVRLSDAGARERTLQAIRSIRTSGMTNLSGGLETGLRMIRDRTEPNEISSVLLFTDGQANQGLTDAYSIGNLVCGRVPTRVAARRRPGQPKSEAEESHDMLMRTITFPIREFERKEAEAAHRPPPRAVPVPHPPREMPIAPVVPMAARTEMYVPPQPHVPRPHYGRSEAGPRIPPAHYGRSEAGPRIPPPNFSHSEMIHPQPVPHVRPHPYMQPQPPQQLPAAPVANPPTRRDESKTDFSEITTINTFGFGNDHDADLLQSIAKKGNGMYYFIDKPAVISEAFVNCIGGLTSVVAKDLEVRIEACDGCKLLKVFTDYTKTNEVAERSVSVKLTDLQSEEKRDLFAVFSIPREENEEEGESMIGIRKRQVGTFHLRYLDAVSKAYADGEITGVVARMDLNPPPPISEDLDEVRNRLLCSNALLLANELATKREWVKARNTCSDAINVLHSSPSGEREFVKNLVQDLKDARTKLVAQTYFQGGQQMIMNSWAGHAHQRVANFAQPSQAAYSNCRRAAMMNRAKMRM